jgi:dehydrogenase/reductase SDR family member 12
LASLDAVRSAAAQLGATVPRVDALIHNAGALVHERRMTVDDLELTAQVHVVAPFLLTTLLLPLLHASADARVIVVSSGGMYTQRLDVDALEHPSEPFDGVRVYANAKRAQVVLTDSWARHPTGSGISFQAMHPGWADTPGVQESLPGFRRVMHPLLRSAEQGADTMAWLAAAPEARASNGAFWLDRRPRATTVFPWTRTPACEAARLWSWCVARSEARTEFEAS